MLQIEEFAMIPAKEAKDMLYRMFGEQLVTITVSGSCRDNPNLWEMLGKLGNTV